MNLICPILLIVNTKMAKWYIKRKDKQAGPFETAQLKQLAADGKIKPNDQIRRDDQDTWHKADAVKGLLVKSGNASSTTETPPPLPEIASQVPSPLPDRTPTAAKYPWYHPVSLLMYALCFGGIYFFAQQKSSRPKRASNQPAPQAQAEKPAPSPKQNEKPVDKIDLVMREAANVTHSTKYRKLNSEVLTADFLPQISEKCVYTQIGREPRNGQIYLRMVADTRPSRDKDKIVSYEYRRKEWYDGVNEWIEGPPETILANHQRKETDLCIVAFAPCGYTHNRTPLVIVKDAQVGDSWQLPNKDTYVVEKIDDRQAVIKLDRVSLDRTNRKGDFGSAEDVILLEKGRGIISWSSFSVENGTRLAYPSTEIRRTE